MTLKNNTIKLSWALLCKKSIIDPLTGTLSLIEIFEKVDIDITGNLPTIDKPFMFPFEFELISHWRRLSSIEEQRGEFKYVLFDPDGNEYSSSITQFAIPKGEKTHRNIIRFNGLKITKSGSYIFQISSKEEDNTEFIERSKVELEINIHHDPNAEPELTDRG